jgi:hypothetical protein
MELQTDPRPKPRDPQCRRCGSVVSNVETFLDPRSGRSMRIYKCDCGERIWDG